MEVKSCIAKLFGVYQLTSAGRVFFTVYFIMKLHLTYLNVLTKMKRQDLQSSNNVIIV